MDFLAKEVCVKLTIDEKTEVRGYFDPFTDPEVIKSARRLRMAGAGARSPKASLEELDRERERYFARHCNRFDIVRDGEVEVLSEGEGWQKNIYPFWQYNMVAFFESRAALSGDDEGN